MISKSTELKLRKLIREQVKRILNESKRYGNSRRSRRLREEIEGQFRVGDDGYDYGGDGPFEVVAGPLSAQEVMNHKLAKIQPDAVETGVDNNAIGEYTHYYKTKLNDEDGPFYILEIDPEYDLYLIQQEAFME